MIHTTMQTHFTLSGLFIKRHRATFGNRESAEALFIFHYQGFTANLPRSGQESCLSHFCKIMDDYLESGLKAWNAN